MSESFHGLPAGDQNGLPGGIRRRVGFKEQRRMTKAPKKVTNQYIPFPSFVEHVPLRTRIAVSTRNAWERTKNFVLRRAA